MAKDISLAIDRDTLRALLLGETSSATATSNGTTYTVRAVPGKTLNKSAPDVLGTLMGQFPSLSADVLAPLATLLAQLLGDEGSQVFCDELAEKVAGRREEWLEKAASATDHDLRIGYAAKAYGG